MLFETKRARVLHESLERLLEQGESLEQVLARYPRHASWLKPELEAAAWLAGQRPASQPRPGFVTASRRRLLERTRQARPALSWPAVAAWWLRFQPRKLVVYAALLILLLGQAFNAAKLAQTSPTWLPGDPLYPLKTASENLALLFSFSPEQQARLHIEYTRRRLMEVQTLIIEADYENLSATVSNLDMHVNQALRALDRLVGRDPVQARLLAGDLQALLVTQDRLVAVLAGFVSQPTQAECERVRVIARYGVLATQYMFSPSGGEPGWSAAAQRQPPQNVGWLSERRKSLLPGRRHLTIL